MRKFLTFAAATFITGTLLAGGLVTNTNQSASWVRLPSRNASVGIDAVYYNPAGLMKLNNGFHFSVSNQSIFQTKKVENFYKGPGGLYGLNDGLYEGKVSAPAFPSVYAVYKMDRLAFSFGFNPVGGGGGATFDKGLPSFELSPSDLVPALAASQGATKYYSDAFFEGSSIFFGFQGGVSFKINDKFSVAAGLRYVTAKNTYSGYLKMISVLLPTGFKKATEIMTGIATQATTAAVSTTALVGAGAGGLTLAAAQTAGYISLAQRTALEGALTGFGAPTTVTISTADAVFKGAALKYTQTATLVGDQSADATQTGSGISPIFSVNFSPSENLNIGIKYEMATKILLTNSTTKDLLVGYTASGAQITMFPDGEMTASDMPAMIAVGVDYKLADNFKISAGSNYYFDKNADYGHRMDLDNNSSTPSTPVKNSYIIEHNGFSLQGGVELNITDKLLISGGYIWANKGVNDNYQSDLTYAQASQTFGFGGAFNVMENLQINVGVSYTKYKDAERYANHVLSATGGLFAPRETYYKKTALFGIGVDYSF
jgi:long-chain fatty acid transport protein